MSITYATNSCLVKTPPYIVIGNNVYHYVKVGNLFWFVEFLKEDSGNTYYPDTVLNGIRYYNYYYTANKNNIDNLLAGAYSSGFRIPTQSDFDDLKTHFTGDFNGTEQKKFRATTWENGTNEYGTNFVATGIHLGNGGTDYRDTTQLFLLKDSGYAVVYPRGGGDWSEAGWGRDNLCAPLRLCRTV